ncbi:site-specific integrase [Rhizobium leguminosarum]|uniref:site-specific integrase n=1 Tax=Rhizobium leguminosarum TaxID=384 RepID=UPI0010303FEB|nr:site-specific integrase [Rhizobium leguminosarum]TBG66103.1 site-specific integrase [Rhizobium leguminosarum]TBG70861.1 site-specific integrase [Rhizobium leguminosarum]
MNHFLTSRALDGTSWRTVEKAALALADFWDYLFYNGIAFREASLQDLKNYTASGCSRFGNVVAFGPLSRINYTETDAAKLNIILSFYRFLAKEHGITLREHRGETLATITLKRIGSKVEEDGTPVTLPYREEQKQKIRKRRPTPNVEQAGEIIHSTQTEKDPNRRSTWFLIANLERFAGFRAVGCSSVRLSSIYASLGEEALFLRSGLAQKLKQATGDWKLQLEIKSLLAQISVHGRKYIPISIVEKGGNSRLAPVPIPLVVEILDYAWSEREAFIKKRQQRHPDYEAPDELFLSFKTGSALQNDSISNKLSSVFRKCKIPGSGHRLRATFCQEVVRDLYLRDRALNGRAWQPGVVIATAREMMGHLSVETLESYLNDIVNQENSYQGEPVLVRDLEDAAVIRGLSDMYEGESAEWVRAELKRVLLEAGGAPRKESNMFRSLGELERA